jgi:hypothetical protein
VKVWKVLPRQELSGRSGLEAHAESLVAGIYEVAVFFSSAGERELANLEVWGRERDAILACRRDRHARHNDIDAVIA